VQVAVLSEGNKAVLKSIQLGRDFGDSVEVISGLAPQDRIAHPRRHKSAMPSSLRPRHRQKETNSTR
jgi:hypothetical protein